MRIIVIIIVVTLFNLNYSAGQWIKINAIPSQDVVALTTIGDTILAASDVNILYKSIDGGISWNPVIVTSNPIHIITLKVIDDKIYIGTFNEGIYSSADYGFTWVHTGIGLPAVAGIEKMGNDLYATTLGNGVYTYNQNAGDWIPFNNFLPSYSVNVFTIVGTSNSLLIGAGANGTFYRYDFYADGWNEEYYYGSLHPGLLIQKLINNSDTVFAVNQDRIIRSEDDGFNWTDDTVGTHDGFARYIYPGANYHYLITNTLTNGTWIQQRIKSSTAGSTWATNEEFIPNGYAYDILEFHDKLFLAKADGLYVKALTAGITDLVNTKDDIKIYIDRSNASLISVSSNIQVRSFAIITTLGQIEYSGTVGKNEFAIQANLTSGIYFLSLRLLNGRKVTDKIIIE